MSQSFNEDGRSSAHS